MEERFYVLFVWITRLQDLFRKPGGVLHEFGIKKGDTVVDYGCGPGRYLKTASGLAGEEGRVFAADISPRALQYSNERIRREGLANVTTVLVGKEDAKIPDHCADVVYALDMFHGIGEPEPFLKELNRIVKPGGSLYLEDGHQSRESTKRKTGSSKLWKLECETKTYVVLKPAAGN